MTLLVNKNMIIITNVHVVEYNIRECFLYSFRKDLTCRKLFSDHIMMLFAFNVNELCLSLI